MAAGAQPENQTLTMIVPNCALLIPECPSPLVQSSHSCAGCKCVAMKSESLSCKKP